MKQSSSQYAQALYKLTKDKSQEEINVVIEKFVANLKNMQKLHSVEQIIKQFIEVYNEKNGIIKANIFTRKDIDEEIVTNIKKILKERYKAEKIEMEMTVDEKLKGGIKIMVEEDILDNSIAGRLNKLRSGLIG